MKTRHAGQPFCLILCSIGLLAASNLPARADSTWCPPSVLVCIAKAPEPLYPDSVNPSLGPIGSDPSGEGFGELPPAGAFIVENGEPVMIGLESDEAVKAFREYGHIWVERRSRDQELKTLREQTLSTYGSRIDGAVADVVAMERELLAAAQVADRLASARATDDKIAELDRSLDQSRELARAKTASVSDIPLVPPETQPDFVDKSIDPGHHESFNFATPKGTPDWDRLVETRRYYRAAKAFSEADGTYVQERQGLLALADVTLHAADLSFVSADKESGDTLLEAANSLLDSVFDIAVDAVRGAMESGPAAFIAGALEGAFGLPLEPVPGRELEYGLGEVIGAAAGLAGDAAAIYAGLTSIVGGSMVAVSSGGFALPLGVAAVAAGQATALGGLALTNLHAGQLQEGLQYLKSGVNGASGRPSGYRAQLAAATGQNPSGDHAHHMLPRKFREDFKKLGLDVDDALYGAWWEARDHLSKAYEYNQLWKVFFETPGNTAADALQFARDLAQRYRLTVRF